ncbi:MAG: efflux RND transporter periplasmic adaptor subunit [Anaerolineales bacterium]|nr:efflux RND transporter periplasmic adaptor subunit [Anaerolineales bacterium]
MKTKETKEKTNRKYWIIAAVVILLVGGAHAAYSFWYLPSRVVESEEATIQSATARKGDITLYAAGAGTLIPAAEVDVSFDISENVQEELVELLVGVGDKVEVGDVLARLDDSDRQENLTDAQRDLRELTSASAMAGIEKELANTKIDLEDNISNFVGLISPAVYKAESYVEDYTFALAEAQAVADASSSDENDQLLKTAEQNLKWSESNLSVQLEYYKDEYLPENFEDYYWDDNDNKVYFTAAPTEAEIASVRAEISLAEASIAELEILLAALKNNEDLPEEATGSQVSAIRQARQAVDDALEDLEATNLVAPLSGTVTQLNANVSEMVGNEVVMVISDLTPPTLEAYFDESDWKNIQEGFPVEVIFDALPDAIFEGQVVHVNPGLVSQNNTTVVYSVVELDTSQTGWNGLPIGSAAGVDVIGGKAENAILVPVEALREISEGEYAVFVMEDGVPRMKLVEVGLQDLIYAEIISGIKQGDVVTTGQVETAQ